MNNKPVAWIRQGEYGKPIIVQNPLHQFSYQAESAKWDDIPLYTHPAKEHFEDEPQAEELHEILQSNTHPAKTLTDEEIWKLWQKHLSDDIPVFARAILRKAQDK